LVSVILAVYNGEAYIAEALASLCRQTQPQLEVIVVDDGSTDATASVLERFAERINVVRQQNRGVSAARNRGLERASGTYVAFVDYDDLWAPTFLERLTARLNEADDSVAGAVATWREVDAAGQPLPALRRVGPSYGLPELAQRCCFPPSGVLLRRAAVIEAGGWDNSFPSTQDWVLWLRLADRGRTFVGVDELLWYSRQHERNISRDPDLMRADVMKICGRYLADPALTADRRALHTAGLGNMLYTVAVRFYERGREEDGHRTFAEAATLQPALLRDEQTYWALLCAEQPVGGKAGPAHLDLERAATRVRAALGRVFDAPSAPRALERYAHARTYAVLAQLAYGQRHMAAVRRYAARALRADPRLWRDRRLLACVLKSLAGPAAVDVASRWKRARLRTPGVHC
jgi:glycosyltransferase involved in cell wall biosynthesis